MGFVLLVPLYLLRALTIFIALGKALAITDEDLAMWFATLEKCYKRADATGGSSSGSSTSTRGRSPSIRMEDERSSGTRSGFTYDDIYKDVEEEDTGPELNPMKGDTEPQPTPSLLPSPEAGLRGSMRGISSLFAKSDVGSILSRRGSKRTSVDLTAAVAAPEKIDRDDESDDGMSFMDLYDDEPPSSLRNSLNPMQAEEILDNFRKGMGGRGELMEAQENRADANLQSSQPPGPPAPPPPPPS